MIIEVFFKGKTKDNLSIHGVKRRSASRMHDVSDTDGYPKYLVMRRDLLQKRSGTLNKSGESE
ncbi:MAG: hypothetical protein IIY39_01280 [Firmicutes bacterium]|nr:hypothetical protein [Bacillota bacterium]